MITEPPEAQRWDKIADRLSNPPVFFPMSLTFLEPPLKVACPKLHSAGDLGWNFSPLATIELWLVIPSPRRGLIGIGSKKTSSNTTGSPATVVSVVR